MKDEHAFSFSNYRARGRSVNNREALTPLLFHTFHPLPLTLNQATCPRKICSSTSKTT